MSWLDKYRTAPKPKGAASVPANVEAAPAGDPQAARYAEAALRSATWRIAHSIVGERNDTLNREAYTIGQLCHAGHLDAIVAQEEMWAAAQACGLDDGEIGRTIPRAVSEADAREVHLDPTYTPPVDVNLEFTPDTPTGGTEREEAGVGGEEVSDGDTGAEEEAARKKEEYLARQREVEVAREAHRLDVLEEARRLHNQAQAAQLDIPTPMRGDEFLAIEDPPITWLLEGLQQYGTRALLAAQAKAGKTTMVANLIKALTDQQTFLNRFINHFDGTVTLIDNELDERMLRRWLKGVGITHPERLHVIPLRGKLESFDIMDDEHRSRWADTLRGTDYLILDCLRPALDGNHLDEHHDAGRFLGAFDALLDEAGIDSALVVHHMGHGSTRARGDSRIQDWPDANWRLTRDNPDDPRSERSFHAFGREVNIDNQPVIYTHGRLELEPEPQEVRHRREFVPSSAEEWVIDIWRRAAEEEPKPKAWWTEQTRLDNGSWKPGRNTVRTVFDRLVDEGVMETVAVSGGTRYRPHMVSNFVQNVLFGTVKPDY